MNRRPPLIKLVSFAFAVGCLANSSSGNLVVNGGFEQPVLSVPSVVHAAGSGGLTGWTISGTSGIDHVGTLWQPAEGNQSISLNWTSPSTVSQTLATVASQDYLLGFSLAAELPELDSSVRTIDIFWGATLVDSLAFDPAGLTSANMGWQSFSYTVTGSGSDTLSFASTTAANFGPTLDGVSVSAVPEPSHFMLISVVMMLICFGRPTGSRISSTAA